jgi:hypothetical protein
MRAAVKRPALRLPLRLGTAGLAFAASLCGASIKLAAQWRVPSVSAVKFDSSGNRVLVGFDDGRVELHDLRRPTSLIWRRAFQPPVQIYGVYFARPDRRDARRSERVLVVETERFLRLLSAAKGIEYRTLFPVLGGTTGPLENWVPEGVVASDYDRGADVLALAGDRSNAVRFVRLGAVPSAGVDTLLALSQWWRHLDIMPGSSAVMEVRNGFTLDPSVLTPSIFDIEAGPITDIRFCDRGRLFAATTAAGTLAVWRLAGDSGSRFAAAAQGHEESAERLAFRKVVFPSSMQLGFRGLGCAGTLLITVGDFTRDGGQGYVWGDTSEIAVVSDTLREVDGSAVRRVVVGPSGEHAVTVGDLKYVVWDLKDGRAAPLYAIRNVDMPTWAQQPNAVDIAPDGARMAVGFGPSVLIMTVRTALVDQVIGTPLARPPTIQWLADTVTGER